MLLIFRNAGFRVMWISGVFNDMAMIMFMVVHAWLVLTITDSPFWVGASAGVAGLGLMSFSVIGGVMVDRLDRRILMLTSMAMQAAIALSMAFLIFSDRIELWHLLVAAYVDGLIVPVKVPARMALTLDLVGRDQLLSATASTFTSMTLMGIVAPLVAGAMLSAFDIGWAYLVMSGAYLLSVAVLLSLRGVVRAPRPRSTPWDDLKQGVRYVLTTPIVRTLILMAIVTEFFGWAHEPMLAVMARDVLGIGASGLGFLLAGASAGGLMSTLVVANMGDVKEKGRLLIAGFAGFGIFLIAFAWSPWFPLSLVLLGLAYASIIAYEASLNTLLQTVVPDNMRGRVLSFQTFTWAFTGLSGFHTGAIASAAGAPTAISIGAVVLLLNALRLARKLYRFPIPQPEAAAGD